MSQLRRIVPRSLFQAALLLAFVILFGPLLVPLLRGRVFTHSDLGALHLPLRFLYQQALGAGDNFLWSSALNSGVYLHGDGEAGMAHPLHLLLYRFLPLTAAFNVEILTNFPVALAGAWLLFRRFGLRSEAACAGALVFAFSGFNLLHLIHLNAITVIAQMPWLLLAADVLLTSDETRARAGGFAGVALVLGSQLLAGFPQGVYYSGIALAWLTVLRLVTHRRIVPVLWLAAAGVAGVLIGGIQVLPTLDSARTSFRSSTPFAFRLTFSLHPLNLLQLVSPYTFALRVYAPAPDEWFPHELGIYNGAISTLALGWTIVRRHKTRHRPIVLGLLSLAGLGLVLSLGRYGGLYTALAHLPGISGFRAPARHIVLVHLACAGLVAVMIDDLRTAPESASDGRLTRLWPIWGIAAVSAVVAATGFAAAAWRVAEPLRLNATPAAFAGPVFMLASAAALIAAARGARGAAAAVVLIAAIDLACWGTRYVWKAPVVSVRRLLPIEGLPPSTHGGDVVHPFILDDMNQYPMWHLRTNVVYLALVQNVTLDPASTIAQRLAGVRWDRTPRGWTPVADPMSRTRLVVDWKVSQDIDADLPTIDIARTALVDVAPGATAGPPGAARLVLDRPGRLQIETSAPAPQLLVIAERFHDGWRADVDGAPVRILRAYGDFMACLVPAGTHRVSLTFAPASFRHGAWMTAAGLLLAIAGTGLAARRLRPDVPVEGQRSGGRIVD